MTLKGKNILFISPNFFNYEYAIIDQLKRMGAQVSFYNERPNNSILTRGLIRVNKKLIQKKIHHYYQSIISDLGHKKFDYFLLIKGESIPYFFLSELKKRQPNIVMLYYNYDSFTEYPRLLKLLPFFDKNITFDRQDAQTHQLEFLPLFYTDHYRISSSKSNTKYTLGFVGSIHSDRYPMAQKVKKILDGYQLSYRLYFYAPNRFSVWMKKVFDRTFHSFSMKDLSFKSLSTDETINIYQKSDVILDICKPFQNGLTMRTFEALAMQKKIITTNPNVIHYPFYNSNNILVINREKVEIPLRFLQTPYLKIDNEIVESYSLQSWIISIFRNC